LSQSIDSSTIDRLETRLTPEANIDGD